MRRAPRALLLLLACALTFVPQLRGQNDPPVPTPAPLLPQGAPLDATTVQALERLTELLTRKRAERAAASAAGDLDRAAALETEVRDLGWQFGGLCSRLDVQQFEAPAHGKFDLQAEVEESVRPLVQMLKDVTEGPRKMTELRGHIELLEQRQTTAEAALRTAERTRDALPAGSPARTEAEREIAERWTVTITSLRDQVIVLKARLLSREQAQKPWHERLREVAHGFLSTSGVSLLLAAGVFVSVLLTLRFIQNRLMRHRTTDRTFSLRLLEVLLSALTMLITVGATLVVPYVRDDWLLLAVGLIFLVGVGWVLVRMLPQFFEQIRLVLNVGGVREGERIVIEGLPYRVDQLRFYSRLTNPDLQGGELRVPIQDLIGKRSRRSAPDEPWFPCRAGEVVMLADGVIGPVLSQSPSCVVIDHLGAPRSYTVSHFLAQKPRNLSRGFVVDTLFGVDHRHQGDATATIPLRLRDALQRGLSAMVPAGQLLGIEVQFAAVGSNSLDYQALATFAGEAAGRFLDLRRAMQRLLVEACSENGWSIPAPQLVVHRPSN